MNPGAGRRWTAWPGRCRGRGGEAAEILGHLRGRGLATATGDAHHLTEDGRLYALQVVRTHRLYETWLARETSTPGGGLAPRGPQGGTPHGGRGGRCLGRPPEQPALRSPRRPDSHPRGASAATLAHLAGLVAGWQTGAHRAHRGRAGDLFRQAEALGLAPGTASTRPGIWRMARSKPWWKAGAS